MKNKIIIILMALSSLLFFGCYQSKQFIDNTSRRSLSKRTDKLIKKSHEIVDTVYLYSYGGTSYIYSIWYHKEGYIHSFWLRPYKTKVFKPVEAKNIIFDSNSFNECFSYSFEKEKSFECFPSLLGGGRIVAYIKGENRSRSTSIDEKCLFSHKYPENSFPYKLQYDLSIIFKPLYKDFNYDFEKMYSE